jgi:hypothetical protein
LIDTNVLDPEWFYPTILILSRSYFAGHSGSGSYLKLGPEEIGKYYVYIIGLQQDFFSISKVLQRNMYVIKEEFVQVHVSKISAPVWDPDPTGSGYATLDFSTV